MKRKEDKLELTKEEIDALMRTRNDGLTKFLGLVLGAGILVALLLGLAVLIKHFIGILF